MSATAVSFFFMYIFVVHGHVVSVPDHCPNGVATHQNHTNTGAPPALPTQAQIVNEVFTSLGLSTTPEPELWTPPSDDLWWCVCLALFFN